ncbi:MAG: thiamine pyrophosphate-binding protein, partial [Acidimicrobiia bacterium]
MTDCTNPSTTWHKVADLDELPEGRVKTVHVGRRSLALAHYQGSYGALDNKCPHQGGPLGEGSIEHGWLRCPWHGYDYNPLDGRPPEGFSDAPSCFQTEVREDGVYVAVPPEVPHQRTVSDVLVETMVNAGVTHVFGMVGHSNLGFANSMREAELRGDLTFIGIRHEGAAAFAASAFGKLTGGLAACFGIAGPGSTNLLTGLYDAKVDRAPILAISGQVPSKDKGRGAFQDLDIQSAFADVAAFSETVNAGSDPAELMTLACKTALVDRDVAHLMLPDEVQQLASDAGAGSLVGRTGAETMAPPAESLQRALEVIASAERPLFIVGAGARQNMAPIIECAEAMGVPVVTTFKAKGQISDSHPLGCGVLGRSGTPIASWFMNESDVLIAFGASFSNHTGIADYKPIVQVDHDPMALGRFHPVEVPVLGDVGVTAHLLQQNMPENHMFHDRTDEVAQRWALWRAEKESRRNDDSGAGINSASIFDSLSRLVDPDAAIAVDVGNNTYSCGRYFDV